jgi:hypothetical protein
LLEYIDYIIFFTPLFKKNYFVIETLYLRRRALLLQEKSTKVSSNEESFRRSYLQLRSTILFERYGVPKEILCSRSRSVSLRGMNVSLSENKNHNSQDDRYMTIQQMLDHVCTCHYECSLFMFKFIL